eukprot:1161875-Pelagomonas_calceolata.AAC.6
MFEARGQCKRQKLFQSSEASVQKASQEHEYIFNCKILCWGGHGKGQIGSTSMKVRQSAFGLDHTQILHMNG